MYILDTRHDCIYIHQRDDCSKLVPNSSFDSSSGVEGTNQGETSSSMTSSLASGENSWFKNWLDFSAKFPRVLKIFFIFIIYIIYLWLVIFLALLFAQT